MHERPAVGPSEGALVFFHGHWGVGGELLPLLDELDPERRLHAYAPDGPLAMSEGRARWFNFDDPAGAPVQLERVAGWLGGLPFPPARVVLGGWSQGALVAFALGLGTGRPRPAALLGLGGSLPSFFAKLDLTPPLPPVAIAHGAADDVVPVAAARNARRVLEAAGARVLYRETAVGHELDPAVVPDLRAFLAAVGG